MFPPRGLICSLRRRPFVQFAIQNRIQIVIAQLLVANLALVFAHNRFSTRLVRLSCFWKEGYSQECIAFSPLSPSYFIQPKSKSPPAAPGSREGYVAPRTSRSSCFYWVHLCESYPWGYQGSVLIRWLGSFVSNALYSPTLQGLGHSCLDTLGTTLVCLHRRRLLWTTLLTLGLFLQLFRAWLRYCLCRVILDITARADAGEDIDSYRRTQAFVETYLHTFSFFSMRWTFSCILLGWCSIRLRWNCLCVRIFPDPCSRVEHVVVWSVFWFRRCYVLTIIVRIRELYNDTKSNSRN